MPTGYTRQSAGQLVDGNAATAAMFNNEYNKLQEAFNITTGHNHDGTVGGGAKIAPTSLSGSTIPGVLFRISDTQFASRPIQGTANQIKVQQGDGVLGSPVISFEDTMNFTGKTVTGGTFTGITISSSTTINKSPTVTFGGDFAGSTVFTNLDSVTLNGTLAGLSNTGMVARTGAGAFTARTISGPANNQGLVISNGNGVAGNPTINLSGDLASIEALATVGMGVRTAADTWQTRTIQGTTNQLTVTNGDGVGGNPVISFPQAVQFPGSVRVNSGGIDVTGATSTFRGDLGVIGNFVSRGIADSAGATVLNITTSGIGVFNSAPSAAFQLGSSTFARDAITRYQTGNGSAQRTWEAGVQYGNGNPALPGNYDYYIRDVTTGIDRFRTSYSTGITNINGGLEVALNGSGTTLRVINSGNTGDAACQVMYNGQNFNLYTRVTQGAGAFQFLSSNYGTIMANFNQNGSASNPSGVWGSLSDKNLKKLIAPARGYLDDLNKLRVVKYALKADKVKKADKLGFIAQEVEKVFPHMVDTEVNADGTEYKSLKTSVFIPMLIKAVQELSAKVEALEARA